MDALRFPKKPVPQDFDKNSKSEDLDKVRILGNALHAKWNEKNGEITLSGDHSLDDGLVGLRFFKENADTAKSRSDAKEAAKLRVSMFGVEGKDQQYKRSTKELKFARNEDFLLVGAGVKHKELSAIAPYGLETNQKESFKGFKLDNNSVVNLEGPQGEIAGNKLIVKSTPTGKGTELATLMNEAKVPVQVKHILDMFKLESTDGATKPTVTFVDAVKESLVETSDVQFNGVVFERRNVGNGNTGLPNSHFV